MVAAGLVRREHTASEHVDPERLVGAERACGPPAPRRCGRCRLIFPGDITLDPSVAPKWWVCPPCRIRLFGDGSHPHMSSRWATETTPSALRDGRVGS
jgi:hypothetical protein